jgi:WD40 repeat protein
MKHHSFPLICLILCLILPGCSTKPHVTSSSTVKPLAVFSSSNVDRIIEQSKLGEGQITAGEFSPNGKRFGAITPLGVYIYDVETLNQEQFVTSDSPLRAAAFSPDWSLLALGTGSTITLRHLANNKVLSSLETQQGQVTRLLFSPDGSLLASFVTPPGEEVYAQVVELWRVSDSKLLSTWEVSVYDEVLFTPDSKAFYAWNVSQGMGFRRWQIPTGLPLPAWEGLDPYPTAFSPDGDLYAAAMPNAILIQRTSDKTQVSTLSIKDSQYANLIRFSSDGSLLAAIINDGTVHIWRIVDGTLLNTFKMDSAVNLFVTISPDNKMIAIPMLDGIAFYDLKDGSLVQRLHNHSNGIYQAAISPKGDKVAAVAEDGLIVWDLLEGKVAYSLSRVGAIHAAWSPDGQWLVLGGWDKNLNIVRAEDGKIIRSIPAHQAQVQSVAFSPDGSMLASSSMVFANLWRFNDGSLLHSFPVSGGWVSMVRFSVDGKYLAATAAEGKVEIWQVVDRKHVAELPAPELGGDKDVIAFAPDNDFLAIGETSQIGLWHLTEDKPFQTLPISGAKVITLRISLDGSLLVCGLTDGTIQFWQIPEGKRLRTLKGGNEGISSLDFSADGQTLISASRDGTIRIWKISK